MGGRATVRGLRGLRWLPQFEERIAEVDRLVGMLERRTRTLQEQAAALETSASNARSLLQEAQEALATLAARQGELEEQLEVMRLTPGGVVLPALPSQVAPDGKDHAADVQKDQTHRPPNQRM